MATIDIIAENVDIGGTTVVIAGTPSHGHCFILAGDAKTDVVVNCVAFEVGDVIAVDVMNSV
jgi:AICAR transformylase/IMP cyclohydrolase PurH